MVEFYKIWKRYNEIPLTKNKKGLKQSNNEKLSTFPHGTIQLLLPKTMDELPS